jgi:hypothetical protein
MQTLNLQAADVMLLINKGKDTVETLTMSYDITGFTYASKIINTTTKAVIATLTTSADTVNRQVTLTISAANSLLIAESGHSWYIEEDTGPETRVIMAGPVKNEQVTDL